jgi:hypothetical protein
LLALRGNSAKLTASHAAGPSAPQLAMDPRTMSPHQLMMNTYTQQMMMMMMMMQQQMFGGNLPGNSGGPSIRMVGSECPADASRRQPLALMNRDDRTASADPLAIVPCGNMPGPHALPTPSPTKSDASMELSPADQAKRFVASMQGTDPLPSEDDDENDDDDTAIQKKTATKGNKAKAKSKAKAKAKGKAGKTAEHVYKPVVSLEITRSQYLFRPGLPYNVCGESTQSFKFDAYGGKSGAAKAANKHLADFKKTHKCI